MPIHDYDIANAAGSVVRVDINNVLDAIVENNSNPVAPSPTFAYMWWADTTTDILKLRNSTNTAFVDILTITTGTPISITGLSNIVEDTTPQLGGVLDTNGFTINESEGAFLTAAATTNIWITDGNTVHIAGATPITSFGTAPNIGAWRNVIFDNILMLTDGVNLNLQGGADIITATDDFAFVYAETTTLFKVLYFKADGTAVVGETQVQAASKTQQEAATDNTVFVTPLNQKFHPSAASAYGLLNGIGAVSIKDSFNVSSITDLGTGKLRMNYANTMSSTNYGFAFGSGTTIDFNNTSITHGTHLDAALTVGNISVASYREGTGTAVTDSDFVSITIFGDLQ